ncbi:hypothetical protein [Pseudoalteromonas luteoviolacea]|uniref:hypothetical protein n=1 Tax=Pseudoalteromonas luteoviolacea TaxID=43657 RepID=UPI0011545F60|nr:hypothetical protein [Pseudoalteromonas luteoviolacea]TQF66183.1 hypothetical protein FLM44_25505 [Pseudoalteromonas luteoviolacea]
MRNDEVVRQYSSCSPNKVALNYLSALLYIDGTAAVCNLNTERYQVQCDNKQEPNLIQLKRSDASM